MPFPLLKKKAPDSPGKPPEENAAAEFPATPQPAQGWWARLSQSLQKSTTQLSDGISGIFTKQPLDEASLEQLEELLITADIGVKTAQTIVQRLRKSRFGKMVSDQEIRAALAAEITTVLQPVAKTLNVSGSKPFVVLMVGVNGVGKTTTLGKMAKQLYDQGKSVLLVAGDTFRAAAVAQLEVWATRAQAPLIAGDAGMDPASLAYKALEHAQEAGSDVVMVDTAGRLHNKTALMAELQKIIRVMRKLDATAPHATLLVLDATTGQNALTQVEVFSSLIPISGLILTKCDGSARGGVLVALAEKYRLPVYALGIGEAIEDLQPFAADAFAKALCGVE